ncbi:MAG: endonuclease/exonuclease/phosphatase family protein [Phycisphaerales bacterium]
MENALTRFLGRALGRAGGRLLLRSVVVAAAALAAGCASGGGRAALPANASTYGVAQADDHYVYFRFNPDDKSKTLQDSDETVAILLDTDGDGATGYARPEKPFVGMGFDLEVQFSPLNASGGAPGHGVAFFKLDRAGHRTEIERDQTDFVFTPSYAAEWYDARMSRLFAKSSGLPAKGMASRGEARGVYVVYSRAGAIVGYSERFGWEFPQIASGPLLADSPIPAKSGDAVRFVAWNVWGKMQETPAKFCAVLRPIDPDVVMFAEWKGDAAALEQILNQYLPGKPWHAATGPDVAIASRDGVSPAGPRDLEIAWNGEKRKVRFVSASVSTRLGQVLVGEMHLKCCGGAGSSEDTLRIAEADAINQGLRQISRADASDMVVIGGDLNLVGTRTPLDVLRMGLDGGADLENSEPVVLGDSLLYTWRDWTTGFSPGRLDWLSFTGSTLRPTTQFVFDPARLSDSALSKAGLMRATGQPSDHLPVVVELRGVRK